MNKRHYEHTLPNIRGSLSNTYVAFIAHAGEVLVRNDRNLKQAGLCNLQRLQIPDNPGEKADRQGGT